MKSERDFSLKNCNLCGNKDYKRLPFTETRFENKKKQRYFYVIIVA